MRFFTFLSLFLGTSAAIAQNAQTDTLRKVKTLSDAVTVTALRADDRTPVAVTNLSRKDIQNLNSGQDLPYVLAQTPSVVVFSDAGAGVGYTGMRIRGSDASRVNITLNGIPVNDAESQSVFFVNMPDLTSGLNSIQIQRGVGTSTNGAGSFGASVNLETGNASEKAWGDYTLGIGSFNTWRHSLRFGTGKMNNGWAIDGRLSRIWSDGYIDSAFSRLQAGSFSASRVMKKSIFKVVVMMGNEKTYQAWNGVPFDSLPTRRTYNMFTYPNQTDNYWQNFYQAFYSYQLRPNLLLNTALFYTRGKGYYEEYRSDEAMSLYQISPVIQGGDTIRSTDLIRRRWLDNHNYGGSFSLQHNTQNARFTLGGMVSLYEGHHLGEVIWARYASTSEINHPFYSGYSNKGDYNLFLKSNINLNAKWSLFGDLQYRYIHYTLQGQDILNSAAFPYDHNLEYSFFNPKAGIQFEPARGEKAYFYVGLAGKEPVRNDLINATRKSKPQAEQLTDFEAGYSLQKKSWSASVNFYWMEYYNQLVNDGSINDVGAYNRINVPSSYRAGIELQGEYRPTAKLTLWGNATLSRNKIRNFNEYADYYDSSYNYLGNAIVKKHDEVSLAFSPNLTASYGIRTNLVKGLNAELFATTVSSQYLDNSQSEDRILDGFTTLNLRASYETPPAFGFGGFRLMVQINNLTNVMYQPNGYTYGWFVGAQRINNNFAYPQAGTNIMGSISLRF